MDEPPEHRPNSAGAEGNPWGLLSDKERCGLGRPRQESGSRVLSYQRQEMVSQGVKDHNPKQMCKKADEEIIL